MALLVTVVDDDASVRQSLNRLIRSARHEVKLFASAEEFLEWSRAHKPDCLILDVRLPGMSGPELHRHLIGQDYHVPTIFITAHGSDEAAREAASSDWTVAYLIKPFGGDELLDAVEAALKWKKGS